MPTVILWPVKRISITPLAGAMSLKTRSKALFGPPTLEATSTCRAASRPLIEISNEFVRVSMPRVAANLSRALYFPGATRQVDPEITGVKTIAI